jgi:ABC-type lipoprotein release transport system permease subunit
MARAPAILTIATLVIVLVSVGHAQQVPATDSVADAAREQKALSKQKKPAQKKVYTNSDVGVSEGPASSPNTDQPAVAKNEENLTSGLKSGDELSSIFDRSKQDLPETIVVPAGTKIAVDVFEENPPRNLPLRVHSAKVVNIVQVGSTVVIPALSKVTIQESTGVMELTDVTIDGVRYALQTDRVPLFAESMFEATFRLTRAFAIKR